MQIYEEKTKNKTFSAKTYKKICFCLEVLKIQKLNWVATRYSATVEKLRVDWWICSFYIYIYYNIYNINIILRNKQAQFLNCSTVALNARAFLRAYFEILFAGVSKYSYLCTVKMKERWRRL